MIDSSTRLLRERIRSLTSFGYEPSFVLNYPWLRISCESGKMFEVVPESQDIEPQHEIFEIKIREVDEFGRAQKWPEGPSVEWLEVEEILNHVRGLVIEEVYLHVTDQGLIGGNSYPASSGISLVFETGSCVTFRHSERLPMSVDVEITEGDEPHNQTAQSDAAKPRGWP